MQTIRTKLTKIMEKAFEVCGYDTKYAGVIRSDRPDLCQFQCNGALAAAKEYRKAPAMIAGDVIKQLEGESCFKSVALAMPGFINIIVTDEYLCEHMKEMAADDNTGIPKFEQDKTLIVDYGGPNVAKPLHVGHLRSAIIGESLKRLAKALGNKTIGDIHLGDWGLQMGLVISEIEERMPELVYFDESYEGEYPESAPVDFAELSEIYPSASKKSKEDEAFKQKAQKATKELQEKRRGYYELWKRLREVSVNDLKGSYRKLNVDFEAWLGESDADEYIAPMIEKLVADGFAYESDGALVVDLALEDDKEPIPPILITKSDGSQLYGTTDLATIIQREKDFKPDEYWYVIDNRQALHIRQVTRCAKKAGLLPEKTPVTFVGFGTMNGKDGKPYKTRDGGIMKLSDLIATVTDAAAERMRSGAFTSEFSEQQQKSAAEKIGVAALKFGDLINHRTKDYIFDIDRFLSFEGKTGPYLLYCVVRIRSLLAKAKEAGMTYSAMEDVYCDSARDVLLTMMAIPDSLYKSYDEKAPNIVCECAYDLAASYNKFYNENKILGETDEAKRTTWLALSAAVEKMLAYLLDILAIEIPERM